MHGPIRRAMLGVGIAAAALAWRPGFALAYQHADSPALHVGLTIGNPNTPAPAGVVLRIQGPGVDQTVKTTSPGGYRFGRKLAAGTYTVTASLNNQTQRKSGTIKPPYDGDVGFTFKK